MLKTFARLAAAVVGTAVIAAVTYASSLKLAEKVEEAYDDLDRKKKEEQEKEETCPEKKEETEEQN